MAYSVRMYIARIPNWNSSPAVFLRKPYREEGTDKKRTLANLSALPEEQIEVLRRSVKGQSLIPADEGFEITRSRPHGHVAAVLGTLKKLGLEQVLSTEAVSASRPPELGNDRDGRGWRYSCQRRVPRV